MATNMERITISLIPDAVEALQRIRIRHQGYNKADTINRALQVYDYIDGLLAEGSKLQVVEPDGSSYRVQIF